MADTNLMTDITSFFSPASWPVILSSKNYCIFLFLSLYHYWDGIT